MRAAKYRRPRGHIRELPSGSFQVIVYAGTDPLTKKSWYLRETLKTYGAAEVALTRLQSQVDQNRQPKTDITLGQAISRWLEIAKLEDTTRDRYEDLVRLYVRPALGDLAAGKLNAELLESFYARLQRCRDLCDGRRRAPPTCRSSPTLNTWRTLSTNDSDASSPVYASLRMASASTSATDPDGDRPRQIISTGSSPKPSSLANPTSRKSGLFTATACA
jgi:hypothetical protein